MIRKPVFCFVMFLYAATNAWVAPARAQAVEELDQDGRQQRLATMSDLVTEIRVFEIIDGDEFELDLRKTPVTRFNDNVRQFEDGTLWAFTRGQRPLALVKCATNDAQTGRWWHCAASLSTHALRGEVPGSQMWTPRGPGIKFQGLSDAPRPAMTTKHRHLQLRRLARRFSAHQFWNPGNQRFELRLSSRPVLLYSDKRTGVLDGGLFVFTHGVSPALALIVEAVGDDEQPASWRYAIAKLGSAEFHASLDDTEVYSSPRAKGVTGQPADPYYLFPAIAAK